MAGKYDPHKFDYHILNRLILGGKGCKTCKSCNNAYCSQHQKKVDPNNICKLYDEQEVTCLGTCFSPS